ncbi:hypothetical protein ACIQXM_15260 [Arthrobacter sp. NPDC097144]|uniref:hypothetical protein n=1 Tax=Arthrobacter sp. NPDC097144 TaxID=3363946 RepID=UPI0038224769
MKHIPARVMILAAATVFTASCSTGAEERPAAPDSAAAWADQVYQLQQDIASHRGGGELAETRVGGGSVAAGDESSLRFDPIVSGPIAASFLCDTGTVSVSVAGGAPADVDCGQVKIFSSVEPYELGTGLMITVASEADTRWAVEFSSVGAGPT